MQTQNIMLEQRDERIMIQLYHMISAKGLSGRRGLELAEDLYEAGYRPIGGVMQTIWNEEIYTDDELYPKIKKKLEELWNG